MEIWLPNFADAGINVLVTTASCRQECQSWAFWDEADIIIQADDRGAKILKGEQGCLALQTSGSRVQ